MARKPVVTRTITTTVCQVFCVDVPSEETATIEVVLPRTYTEKKLLNAVKEAVDTDDFKAVHIVSTEIRETLYGMSEEDFIKNATILPPRGAKAEPENEEN